jgi:antibiotic biosynthesis monooxygenase (ABM) superfamily enzyme
MPDTTPGAPGTPGAAPTVIDAEQDVATLINVFKVSPERQQQLVEILEEATEQVMRHLPGFRSANIHASGDGTKVVNYAQWASAEDFQAMLEDPDAAEHMSRAGELAESIDPNLYRVVSTHHRP